MRWADFQLYVVSCERAAATVASRGARRCRAAVLPALRTRSRGAGGARRSVPLRASETPIRSYAHTLKGLRLLGAVRGQRPSPSRGKDFTALRGQGWGCLKGSGGASASPGAVPHETTQTQLSAVVEPYYPKGERDRPPVELERLLRMCFVQQ